MESPHRSRTRAGAAAHGEEPTQEHRVWGKLLPVGDPCWSSSRRAAACGKPMQNHFGKDSIPWEGPHREQGQGETKKEWQR